MKVFKYRTIQASSQGIYKEKGSKFLAFAFPVNLEDELKNHLEKLRKEYFDARHHCYAFVLGADKSRFRANDDGEPNHSAGDPILGQIRSKDLTNILIVVVRYFGGTKLGVSGLIQAYKVAAEDALKNAVIIEVDVMNEISIQYDYSATPDVMKLVKDFDLVIKEQSFEDRSLLKAEFKISVEEKLMDRLTLMRSMGTRIEWRQ
jgi:uncharacterized YigZ family protein